MRQIITLAACGLFLIFSISVVTAQTQSEFTPITLENVHELHLLQSRTFENTILIRDLAFHPTNNQLAILRTYPNTGLMGEIHLFEESAFYSLNISENNDVTAVTFSPDGSLFAISTFQGEIIIYDTEQWEQRLHITTIQDIINNIAISSDNAYLGVTFGFTEVFTGGNYAFQVFDLATGELIPDLSLFDPSVDESELTRHLYGYSVLFDDTGENIYFSIENLADRSNQYLIYQGNTQTHDLTAFPVDCKRTDLLLFSGTLYCTSEQGVNTIAISEAEEFVAHNLIASEISVNNIALHPDGSLIAVSYVIRQEIESAITYIGQIKIFDAHTGEELTALDPTESWITSLTFNADGTLLAAGDRGGTVHLWGIPNGE